MSHPRSPLARAVRELAQQLVAEVSAPALEEGRQAGKGVPKSLRSIP
jgi:MinD-like ATPase involved in chromosome partitioning or flagellar assembly